MFLASKTREALESIQKHITTTITTRNFVYIQDYSTNWQMLVVLKKYLAPTIQAREVEVANRYANLKHYYKREAPEE
jgi:hypothetical protein